MAKQYNVEMRAGESLEAYYHRLAKVADQRLVRLERLAEQPGYGNATQWAYRRAMRDIETWSGEGKTRFHTKAPKDTRSLQAKINDIKAFLTSESSTKSDIKASYKQRADTINKKYGTQYQPDDLKKLFDSKLWKKLDKKGIDSDTIQKAIAYIKNSGAADDDEILKGLQAESRKRGKVPKFTGDPMVDEVVRDMLRSKTTVNEMYQFFKSLD